MNVTNFWQLAGLGFIIVLVGVILKDGQAASNLISSVGSSYSGVAKTLEGAG